MFSKNNSSEQAFRAIFLAHPGTLRTNGQSVKCLPGIAGLSVRRPISDCHQFRFLDLQQLVYFRDVTVCELLNLILPTAFVVLRDLFFLK